MCGSSSITCFSELCAPDDQRGGTSQQVTASSQQMAMGASPNSVYPGGVHPAYDANKYNQCELKWPGRVTPLSAYSANPRTCRFVVKTAQSVVG